VSVLVAFTIGLVFWIVAWSLGAKAFDAFMVTALLTLIAVTARLISPTVKRFLKPEA
jgi:hypothetical protein